MTRTLLALSYVGLVAWGASSGHAAAQECKTYEVSRSLGGGPPPGPSRGGSLSDDGRWVLLDGPHIYPPVGPKVTHVWLRDELSGHALQVDLSSTGAPSATWAEAMDLSGDGNVVLFWSTATNLVPGDTNGVVDLFARDLALGLTVRVSVSSTGEQANAASFAGRLSGDGRFVAFESTATNLVPGDTNGASDVFVHDRLTGRTERVSVAGDGSQGDWASLDPSISADGGRVAFTSYATNFFPGDVNGDGDVFVHDRRSGDTFPVSLNASGSAATGGSRFPRLSSGGRYVTFDSSAADLVPGDTNVQPDAFLHDTATASTRRISLGTAGNELHRASFAGPVSTDGRIALFVSESASVTPDDNDGQFDVFRHDLATGAVTLVSAGWIGWPNGIDQDFYAIDMTPDGSFASFADFFTVFVRGCPLSAARYGPAKLNSQRCFPWISWTGVPSASGGSGFLVRADGKLNQVRGLFLYGYRTLPGSALYPNLLVRPPLFRLPGASTGGSAAGSDCSGSLQVDFNAWVASGVDPRLVAGATVYGQFWSRDPGFAAPADYGFTDAVEITLLP
jgi:Tol biopolymer transport system component